MATTPRRIGAETSATRALILSATGDLLRAEGYGAVSTRRVAAHAGLKPSLVHYYFPTTDDLFLAVFRHGAEQSDQMLADAVAASDPLSALWAFYTDSSRTALALEFMALANHRPAIRSLIAEHCEAMRRYEVQVLQNVLGDRLGQLGTYSPAAISLILAGIGRALIMEGGLGVQSGHAEARALMESLLRPVTAPENALG